MRLVPHAYAVLKQPIRPPPMMNDTAKLNILYWNCNWFGMDKLNQLEAFVRQAPLTQYHIIALVEARPSKDMRDRLQRSMGRSYTVYSYGSPRNSMVIPDYNPPANNRANTGGGIFVLVHNTLFPEEQCALQYSSSPLRAPLDSSHSSDIVWLDIDYGEHPLRLGVAYFHPAIDTPATKALLGNIKDALTDHRGPVVLAGDFNLHHPDWESQPAPQLNHNQNWLNSGAFRKFIGEHGLQILNTQFPAAAYRPTHFAAGCRPGVLDLALATDTSVVTDMQVVSRDILHSDHHPLLISLENYSAQQKRNAELLAAPRPRWKSSTATEEQWSEYASALANAIHSWSASFSQALNDTRILSQSDHLPSSTALIEDAWSSLAAIITATAEQYIGKTSGKPPLLGKRCFETHAADIKQRSDDTRSLLQRTQRAFHRLVRARAAPIADAPTIERLTAYAEHCRDDLRKARGDFNRYLKDISRSEYANFLRTVVDPDSPRPELAWRILRRLDPSNTAQLPTRVNHPDTGTPPASALSSLDNLALYYGNICRFDPALVAQRDAAVSADLTTFREQLHSSRSLLPLMDDAVWPQGDDLFRLAEVEDVVANINTHKAYGPDDIDGHILKHGGPALHHALLALFNACWVVGVIPSQWKDSNVFPLYKKGSVTDPGNYRPISLTCIVARLYERLILPRFTQYLLKRLHPSQAGFRPQHSTSDNIYRLLERVYHECNSSQDRGRAMLPAVFLDLKKAFDKMDPWYLLYKLHHQKGLPLSARLMRFVAAFLDGRRLRVSLSGLTSDWQTLETGTPQGTILGPILFLIYIDDLLHAINPQPNPTPPPANTDGPFIIEGLGYADDILLLPADRQHISITTVPHPAHTEAIFQGRVAALVGALALCSVWARNSLMVFSTDKTNSILFRGRTNGDSPLVTPAHLDALRRLQLSTAGSTWSLLTVPDYNYMGITFNEDIDDLFTKHGEKILQRIAKAAVPLRRLLNEHIPLNIAKTLYNALILPIVHYGLEFLRYKPNVEKRISAALFNIARDVLHLPHHVRRYDVLLHFNHVSLRKQREWQLLTFANRLSFYDQSRLTPRVFLAEMQTCRQHARSFLIRQYAHPIAGTVLLLTNRDPRKRAADNRMDTHWHWPPSATHPAVLNQPPGRVHSVQAAQKLKAVLLAVRRYFAHNLPSLDPREAEGDQSALSMISHDGPSEQMFRKFSEWKDAVFLYLRERNQPGIQAALLGRPRLADPGPPPPLPNLEHEQYIKLDHGLLAHQRTLLRLDKLPTLANLQHYYKKQFADRQLSTFCRACSRRPRAEQHIETQEHIVFHCECPAIADLRRRLRSHLQQFGLPFSLPVIGGQLNAYKLPKPAIVSVLQETGQFIARLVEHFRLPLLKRWVTMLTVEGKYHFDELPP